MDKLIEKHRLVQIQNDGIWYMVHNHANITKEIACGFAEWLIDNHPNIKLKLALPSLFDLYLKSL